MKGILLKTFGDYALFSRPEMKVERVSYDVMTPSAARGILEAIYWKPQIRWIIDEIHVLKRILFTNVRRNEIGAKISLGGRDGVNTAMRDPSVRPSMDVSENRQQRASLLLRNVKYVIRAHFEVLDCRFGKDEESKPENEIAGKHLDQFKRRARKGQFFHHPYFGCREFPADFELIESEDDLPLPCSEIPPEQLNKDLGWMFYDFDFVPAEAKAEGSFLTGRGRRVCAKPRFFQAKMKNGVIDVQACLSNSPTSIS